MEELLIAALRGWAPLTALLGAGVRVHWHAKPQGAPFPCLVLQDVSTLYSHTMQGRVGLTASVVQVDAYAKAGTDALAIKRALIALADTLLTPPLQLELRSARGGLEAGDTPPANGVGASDLRRQTLEFDVWHTPA